MHIWTWEIVKITETSFNKIIGISGFTDHYLANSLQQQQKSVIHKQRNNQS